MHVKQYAKGYKLAIYLGELGDCIELLSYRCVKAE